MRAFTFAMCLTLSATISGCDKCPSWDEMMEKAGAVYIPPKDQSGIAFSSVRKMTFKLNDTVIISYNLESVTPGFDAGDNYTDHCGTFPYKYETRSYLFRSSAGQPALKFDIGPDYIRDRRSGTYYSDQRFYMSKPPLNGAQSYSWGQLDLEKLPIKSLTTSADSTYFDVYKVTLSRFVPKNSPNGLGYYLSDTIYYSTTRGIVRIKDSDGSLYELLYVN